MKRAFILLALLLMGCTRTANTFEVEAPQGASAELRLCGDTLALRRVGSKLTVSQEARCEDAGIILVHVPDQPDVACPVGYVTPGMDQTFAFRVEGGRCR